MGTNVPQQSQGLGKGGGGRSVFNQQMPRFDSSAVNTFPGPQFDAVAPVMGDTPQVSPERQSTRAPQFDSDAFNTFMGGLDDSQRNLINQFAGQQAQEAARQAQQAQQMRQFQRPVPPPNMFSGLGGMLPFGGFGGGFGGYGQPMGGFGGYGQPMGGFGGKGGGGYSPPQMGSPFGAAMSRGLGGFGFF